MTASPHPLPLRGRGFTLVELLVALAVAAILASMAIPSGIEITRNAQVRAAANDVMAHALRARSEAMTRRALVTICASSDGMECTASAGGLPGLITFEGAALAPGDALINVKTNTGAILLTGPDSFGFDARGFALSAVAIVIQRGDDDRFTRRLCIDRPGRIEVINAPACPHEAA